MTYVWILSAVKDNRRIAIYKTEERAKKQLALLAVLFDRDDYYIARCIVE